MRCVGVGVKADASGVKRRSVTFMVLLEILIGGTCGCGVCVCRVCGECIMHESA